MKAGKRFTRLTRRSFRRKLIMFGVSIFASLALTATGFAAWVLSTDAEANVQGGIQVGSVSDAGVEITDIVFKDTDGESPIKNFSFEPAAGDVQGRVRWDNENGKSEDMDIRLGWTIKNFQNVNTTFVEFKIPASVQAAIDKKYIKLPAEFVLKVDDTVAKAPVTEEIEGITYYIYQLDMTTVVKNGTTSNNFTYTKNVDGDIVNVDFVLTLEFEWGAAFENVNPSLYFDTAYADATKGAGVKYEDVKKTLIDLKACTLGITEAHKAQALAAIQSTDIKNSVKDKGIADILDAMSEDEQNAFYNNIAVPTYKVVVHATVN